MNANHVRSKHARGLRICGAALLAAAVVVFLVAPSWLTAAGAALPNTWWRGAVFGTLGLRLAGVFLGSGFLACVTMAVLARLLPLTRRIVAGSARRPAIAAFGACSRGTAIMEFALLFPIAMILFLLTVQAAFMYVGNFYVNLAAYRAARAAMVWMSHDGERPDARHTSTPGPEATYRARQAAMLTCVPIAGTTGALPGGSQASSPFVTGLLDLVGSPQPWNNLQRLSMRCWYAAGHTRVEITYMPRPDASISEWNSQHPDFFRHREPVTVRVSHDFELVVPLARWLIGKRWGDESSQVAMTNGTAYEVTENGTTVIYLAEA